MTSMKCRKLILVGKTGSGKSSLGNSLLGDVHFEFKRSLVSVTDVCTYVIKDNLRIAVMDTPGLFDTKKTVTESALLIQSALDSCALPNAFLIVLSSTNRLTEEEKCTTDILRIIFGDECLEHAIVVFTNVDEEEMSDENFQDFWKESKEMTELIKKCGNRVARIDNKHANKSKRVKEILQLVDELCQDGEKHYCMSGREFKYHKEFLKRRQEKIKEKLIEVHPKGTYAELHQLINDFNEDKEQRRKKENVKIAAILGGVVGLAITNPALGLVAAAEEGLPILAVVGGTTIGSAVSGASVYLKQFFTRK